jgi:hypothetical protein
MSLVSSNGFSPSDPASCSEVAFVETTAYSSARDVSGCSIEDCSIEDPPRSTETPAASSKAIGANLGEMMGVRGRAVNLI